MQIGFPGAVSAEEERDALGDNGNERERTAKEQHSTKQAETYCRLIR